MAPLLQVAGHFENLPVYQELLDPTPLWQVYKKNTKNTLNHGKELEFKHCQWLVGICKCKEIETEAIYICTRNRNCNTIILNLACSVFKIDLVLRITVSLGPTQNKMPWINKETWKATWFDLCDPNFYVKLENIYPVLK